MSLSTRSSSRKKASSRSSGRGADRPKSTRAKTRAKKAGGRTSATGESARQDGNKYFVLRTSPIQGRGAFATRPIRRGTRIIEYTGEIISHDEADKRYDDGTMGRHHTFLFSVSKRKVIDAAVGGNEARFINHSCAPNCEAVDEKSRIYIEAIRDIAPGEELTYDYAYERDGTEDEEWEKVYMCRCGAPTCRGTILAPKKERGRK
jgi:SET domain-containing protein